MNEFWWRLYEAGRWISDHFPNVAGLAGAIVSMKFLSGSFAERSLAVFGGWMFSLYTSGLAATYFSVPPETSAFLLGLLGMLILSKLWTVVHDASFAGILGKFLPGVKGKDDV